MKKLLILLVLILLFAGIIFAWWKNGVGPADSKNNSSQIFVIEKGSGVREVANSLKQKGLIKDPIVFFLLTKKLGFDKKIQAGDFRLSPSMGLYTMIEALTHGTLDIWVTIPEGLRALEIADIFEKELPTYKSDWRNTLATNEGYLFPDTYLIPKDADINIVLSLMKNNFDKKYQTLNTSKSNLSKNEIITIASMIEREALKNEEKPSISSVIANRLRDGMSLDIDATLQYIKGKNSSGKWWSVPTADDKKINSPYNTYRNVGLPPSPISNPGFEAINAALNPKQTNYYYYIHDSNGNVHFAETLEKHNENIQKYGL